MPDLQTNKTPNSDKETVQAFSEQWDHFTGWTRNTFNTGTVPYLFEEFFSLFPWDRIGKDATGFEIGCGPGRFAKLIAPKVGHLTLVDAAPGAIRAAKENLSGIDNVTFINASLDAAPIADKSMDFGYSYGVLHHIPDTHRALADCVRFLKPGAPFLVYLYYRFDNRPFWYQWIWALSNLLRVIVSKLPGKARNVACDALACVLYWPLSRGSLLLEKCGLDVSHFPLAQFRREPFMRLRTQSRDRFGTPLEQRFTRAEMVEMMTVAGLEDIRFLDDKPYWCAVGIRAGEGK